MLQRLQQSPTSAGIQTSSYGRLKPLMEEEEEEEEHARERGEVGGASRELESSLWVSEFEQEAEFWNGSFLDGASNSGNGSVWSVLGVEQRGKRWDVSTKHGDQDGQRRQYRRFSWVDTADVLYQCLCDYGQMVWDNKHKCFLQVTFWILWERHEAELGFGFCKFCKCIDGENSMMLCLCACVCDCRV
jgi:hypothetical protein